MKDATRETVTFVTQSRFFSPAFNAAIFDGPIRIYFAQHQEVQALKLYFNFQERFAEARRAASGIFKDRSRNIFVMLYPTDETFELSFGSGDRDSAGGTGDETKRETSGETDGERPVAHTRGRGLGAEAGYSRSGSIVTQPLGIDTVVGVRGPLEDEALLSICDEVDHFVA